MRAKNISFLENCAFALNRRSLCGKIPWLRVSNKHTRTASIDVILMSVIDFEQVFNQRETFTNIYYLLFEQI